ncbi:sugar phosphate isomerase/epimerase [Microlunatus panaciterrae]|uniref:Sugar phosphate isomerase/epimerase n=1 Tax=Microlunatus panaciterrae TaxID=400768 RepID=A0ABS2RHL5_9ACTN|nr:sugar phosphate isomerase/epimerase family protein [Microlunatus panaciterrae]MBM7798042.1 sugar phosphate isomerase/epimerase [Microlunatus panaciterrae]
MWTLSGFSDEISPDFEEQCSVVEKLGLRYLEFRSAWDTNILDLSERQLRQAREILASHDLSVSSIGSPIGKIFIDEEFDAHLERARHAAEVARFFDAPYIRIFSFFLRPGTDPDSVRDEVMRRMSALAAVAAEYDVVMLHENEKEIYGDIPSRCLDIIESVGSPHLRVAWDAANFVQVGVRPFTEAYRLLRPHLEYVQIKDALLESGEVVPAGRGDGEVVETIRALREDGFDGFFSLEPHLSNVHSLGGFSGPELFTEAWQAFTDILSREKIDFV